MVWADCSMSATNAQCRDGDGMQDSKTVSVRVSMGSSHNGHAEVSASPNR